MFRYPWSPSTRTLALASVASAGLGILTPVPWQWNPWRSDYGMSVRRLLEKPKGGE
jgi:hypothetical protein